MLRTCPVCDAPLKRACLTYCSTACYGIARRKRVPVTCAGCQQEFEVRPFEAERARRHFCPSCRALWARRTTPTKTPTGYMLECFNCGAPVYRQRWRSRRYVYTFCCRECQKAGWRNLRLAWEALNGTGQESWPSTEEEANP